MNNGDLKGFYSRCIKIEMIDEEEKKIVTIIDVNEIVYSVFCDSALTLNVLYRNGAEGTINFGCQNEGEYERVKAIICGGQCG